VLPTTFLLWTIFYKNILIVTDWGIKPGFYEYHFITCLTTVNYNGRTN
jgi:hypothetical protein